MPAKTSDYLVLKRGDDGKLAEVATFEQYAAGDDGATQAAKDAYTGVGEYAVVDLATVTTFDVTTTNRTTKRG